MTALDASNNTYFLSGGSNRWMMWIAVSMIIHFAVFVLAYYQSRRVSSPDTLYQKAIMVQPVKWAPEERPKHWMPRMEPTPVPQAVKPEAIKVAPNKVVKPEVKEKTPVKKQPKEKSAEQRRKERQNRMNKALRNIKNNYKSWDGSTKGVKGAHSSEAIKILGSAYAGQLISIFNANFSVPEVIPEEEYSKLKCKILIKIDHSGRIVKHKLQQGSGNSQFDSSALKAVKLTKQVPLPDEILQDMVYKDGILINFRWKN